MVTKKSKGKKKNLGQMAIASKTPSVALQVEEGNIDEHPFSSG